RQLQNQTAQLQSQLTQANQTIGSQRADIARLQSQIAPLQAQLAQANQTIQDQQAEIAKLRQGLAHSQEEIHHQLTILMGGLSAIQADLRHEFKDYEFLIPGNDPLLQFQSLAHAILKLDRGQKHGVYKQLGGRHRHD